MSSDTVQLRTAILVFVTTLLLGCLESQEQGGADPIADSGINAASAPNRAPTISGAPANAVLAGDVYSFTPTASDVDGDRLTFSVQNLPRWASFDTKTGRLTGQTTLGDLGVYDNVRITVSDGSASASLPGFSVTVTDSGLGSMTLSWAAPTENTDGSPLTDLAGFNIYYGQIWGRYPNRIRIDNPSISTYVVENLLPRTYYVVATSFNTAGIESAYSNVATTTVTQD